MVLPIVIAAGTFLGTLFTGLGGVGVGYAIDASNQAHKAVDKIRHIEDKSFVVLDYRKKRSTLGFLDDQMDEFNRKRLFRHPDDRDGDGDLDEIDCTQALIDEYGTDWKDQPRFRGKQNQMMHSCHEHYDGNDGGRTIITRRRRRDATADYEADVGEMSDEDIDRIFNVEMKMEDDSAVTSAASQASDKPRFIISPALIVGEDNGEGDMSEEFGFLEKVCGRVSQDKTVALLVIVGLAVMAIIELMAIIFFASALKKGCRYCSKKCCGGSQTTLCNV